MDQQLPELPHLVVDEPKRSKKVIAGIALLSVLIISVPLGVFLVNQQTQLSPQAAEETIAALPKTSIELASTTTQASLNNQFSVDVLVRSDSDAINLVSAQIKYHPEALKLDKIATSSAEIASTKVYFTNRWLESSSSNQDGQASLIAGLPSPGVKTSQNQTLTLATLFFTSKRLGQTTISFEEDSQLLRNSDNQNVLKDKVDLTLNIEGEQTNLPLNSPSPSPKSTPKVSSPSASLKLINPVGGEVFSYLKPVAISWTSKDVNKIKNIGLYINEEYFGSIASDFVDTGKYEWIPAQTLLLPYISAQNTFQVELSGLTKRGDQIVTKTDGPFGIVAKEDLPSASNSANLEDLVLSINDASLILSQFNTQVPSKVDLNSDGQINQIDLYLLKKILLQRGIIKDSII